MRKIPAAQARREIREPPQDDLSRSEPARSPARISMNQRLQTLLRHRDMLREHLAWIEEEIAREANRHDRSNTQAAPSSDPNQPAPAATPSAFLPEPDIKGLHGEVRRGCLACFVGVMLLLGAVVGFIYWHYRP
jgi:hypothetical protein